MLRSVKLHERCEIHTIDFSVGEVYAGDIERHEQIDRPPRVSFPIGHNARSILHVSTVGAIVSVLGRISANAVSDCADLRRRSISSDVDIEASVHRHCTSQSGDDVNRLYKFHL